MVVIKIKTLTAFSTPDLFGKTKRPLCLLLLLLRSALYLLCTAGPFENIFTQNPLNLFLYVALISTLLIFFLVHTGVLSGTFLSLFLLSSLPQFFTLANSIYNLIMKIKCLSFLPLFVYANAKVPLKLNNVIVQFYNLGIIQSKMVTLLVMIFLGYSAVAKEIEKCDRFQFSFDDPNDINNNQNFTEQYFGKNGQPVYYSLSGPMNQLRQTIIWWNNENNTWLGQTEPYSSNNINKTKIKKKKN